MPTQAIQLAAISAGFAQAIDPSIKASGALDLVAAGDESIGDATNDDPDNASQIACPLVDPDVELKGPILPANPIGQVARNSILAREPLAVGADDSEMQGGAMFAPIISMGTAVGADILPRIAEFFSSPHGAAAGVAAISAVAAAGIAHYVQKQRARVFPALYSGVERLDQTNEAVEFYAAVNDMVAAVTSMWNRSNGSYSDFAMNTRTGELSKKIETLQKNGQLLLDRLEAYRNLSEIAERASGLFAASWKYESHDNYIWVPHVTVNSKGQTSTSLRRQYQDTDHWFTFYRDKAEEARAVLEELLGDYRVEDLYNPGLSRFHVDPTHEDRRSVRDTVFEDDEKIVSDEEVNKSVNQWLLHAHVDSALVGGVHPTLNKLHSDSSGLLDVIGASEGKFHFNTTSESHPGPKGYQYSKRLSQYCAAIAEEIASLEASIRLSMNNAEKLNALMADMEKRRKAKKFSREALDLAVESYLSAFPASEINMDQRAYGSTTAFVATGVAVIAGLLTYLLHPQSGIFY